MKISKKPQAIIHVLLLRGTECVLGLSIMKKNLLILLFTGLIHATGLSQQVFDTIHISPDLELIKLSENAYVLSLIHI